MIQPYKTYPTGELYLGDCLEVMQGIEDKSVDLVLTDPPYNCGIDYGIYKDKLEEKDYINFINNYLNEYNRIANGYLIFTGTGNLFLYPKPRFTVVWIKRNGFGRAGNVIKNCFEPLVYYGNSVNIFSDVYDFPVVFQKAEINHPTPKPPKLLKKLIRDFSKENNLILDSFLGSGTTAVACIETDRRFIGIEISEEYCKIADKRILLAYEKVEMF